MSHSKKLVYASFEIVDIAALVKGASTGEGLGNRFLGSLRDCDAILYVLRAFEDPSVPGDTDPRADLDTLELELVLADLASVEGRLSRQQRAA
jgi:ribosome-binding ATPase YchF (GTP1/OBG family)